MAVKDDFEDSVKAVVHKERKKNLRCDHCPPNRGENRKDKPKHGNKKPKYKDKQ